MFLLQGVLDFWCTIGGFAEIKDCITPLHPHLEVPRGTFYITFLGMSKLQDSYAVGGVMKDFAFRSTPYQPLEFFFHLNQQ